MSFHMILASGSQIRSDLLTQAMISHDVIKPRVDEQTIKQSLLAENATPRDIADCLAESKARKVSEKTPGLKVLGCDQVLDLNGVLMSKPQTPDNAIEHLTQMQNTRHHLLSAAVIYEDGKPIWRHVGKVTLHMRALSERFISSYVDHNWDSIQHAVGCYKLEEDGVRLFTRIEGDYFNVLGLPLLELINYLVLTGELDT